MNSKSPKKTSRVEQLYAGQDRKTLPENLQDLYDQYARSKQELEALEKQLEEAIKRLKELEAAASPTFTENREKFELRARIGALEGAKEGLSAAAGRGLITNKQSELTTLSDQFLREFKNWQKSQVKVEIREFKADQSARPSSNPLTPGVDSSASQGEARRSEAPQLSVPIAVSQPSSTINTGKLVGVRGALSELAKQNPGPITQTATQSKFFLNRRAVKKMQASQAFQPKISIQTRTASHVGFLVLGRDFSDERGVSVQPPEGQGTVRTCMISERAGNPAPSIMQMSHTLAVDNQPGKIDILLTETRQEKQDEALTLMVLAAKKALETFGNTNEFYIENCSNDPETAFKLFIIGKSLGLTPIFKDGAEAAILASSKTMMTQEGTEKSLSDIYTEVKAKQINTPEDANNLKTYISQLEQQDNSPPASKPGGP